MRTRIVRFLIEVTTPPMRAVGFVVGNVYAFLFGGHDRRLAEKREKQLAQDVREAFSFLFAEYGGHFVPDPNRPRTPAFDYAFVFVAVDNVIFSFGRGRGELQFGIAPQNAPSDGHDLLAVLSLLDAEKKIRGDVRLHRLSMAAMLLKPRMTLIKDAYRQDRYPQLNAQLEELELNDRIVTRQFEAELNRSLYRK